MHESHMHVCRGLRYQVHAIHTIGQFEINHKLFITREILGLGT